MDRQRFNIDFDEVVDLWSHVVIITLALSVLIAEPRGCC